MKFRGKHAEGDMGGTRKEGMTNRGGFDSLVYKNITIRSVVCDGVCL